LPCNKSRAVRQSCQTGCCISPRFGRACSSVEHGRRTCDGAVVCHLTHETSQDSEVRSTVCVHSLRMLLSAFLGAAHALPADRRHKAARMHCADHQRVSCANAQPRAIERSPLKPPAVSHCSRARCQKHGPWVVHSSTLFCTELQQRLNLHRCEHTCNTPEGVQGMSTPVLLVPLTTLDKHGNTCKCTSRSGTALAKIFNILLIKLHHSTN
jgi:hypothetical protein